MREPVMKIIQADWQRHHTLIHDIRQQVCVDEMGIPADHEWDGRNPAYCQWLAYISGNTPVAPVRLSPGGSLGRMAMLRDWRGKGVCRAVLERVLDDARQLEQDCIRLGAQRHAAGFNTHFGFHVEGEELISAGLPHLPMHCKLYEPTEDTTKQ